jgi:signal transduction histidine kinase
MELRGIRLRTQAPENAVLLGDLAWLAEALQNIIKNSMENVGASGEIEILCLDNPLYTELTVRDNGAGFQPEDLPRLFDRFYRGNSENASGYGIGLALSKMIVTRQGGSITAKNHPQGGAVFALRFPKVTKESPESHSTVI